jgi:hypothetical protein
MPLFAVFVVVYMVFECVKIPVAIVMGKKGVSVLTREWRSGEDRRSEEEMWGEEGNRLVGGMESEDEDEGSSGRPPAYDEVVRPMPDGIAKGRGDDVV